MDLSRPFYSETLHVYSEIPNKRISTDTNFSLAVFLITNDETLCNIGTLNLHYIFVQKFVKNTSEASIYVSNLTDLVWFSCLDSC